MLFTLNNLVELSQLVSIHYSKALPFFLNLAIYFSFGESSVMTWIFGSFLVTPCALTSCHFVISRQGDGSMLGQSDPTGV